MRPNIYVAIYKRGRLGFKPISVTLTLPREAFVSKYKLRLAT